MKTTGAATVKHTTKHKTAGDKGNQGDKCETKVEVKPFVAGVKKCEEEKCRFHAAYGTPGTRGKKHRKYCLTHAPAEMVYLYPCICLASGCLRVPIFGSPTVRKREYCADHVSEIRPEFKQVLIPGAPVEEREMCPEPGCKRWASLYKHKNVDVFRKSPDDFKAFCARHATADYVISPMYAWDQYERRI